MKVDTQMVNPAFQSIVQKPDKYQYYLTRRDRQINPEWGSFIKQMDALYSGIT